MPFLLRAIKMHRLETGDAPRWWSQGTPSTALTVRACVLGSAYPAPHIRNVHAEGLCVWGGPPALVWLRVQGWGSGLRFPELGSRVEDLEGLSTSN